MSEKKEKFIIFALAGVLLLIVCIPVKKKDSPEQSAAPAGRTAASAEENMGVETERDTDDYTEAMERELEELLSCMEGVGRVKVMITLQSTEEDIVEKDRPASRSNVSENDAAGGSRSTSDMDSGESTVFITDAQGRQTPYVRKRLHPAVSGVAVLAEGGGTESVRVNISEAIQALFGIDANKIKIAKMKTTK